MGQTRAPGGFTDLRVGAAQLALTDDPATNLRAGIAAVQRAADEGCDLVCLPELFPIPYFAVPDYRGPIPPAEALDGPTVRALGTIAQERSVWILTGLYEQGEGGEGHNSVVLIDRDGAVTQVFRKLHIPDLPWSAEPEHFTPGTDVPTADVDGFRIGVSVCYDRHFPEVSRLAALAGAQAIVFPTASRARPGRDRIFTAEIMTRAAENNVYALAVNRTGDEGYGRFFGGSVAVQPDGEVMGQLGEQEDLLVVDWSAAAVADARTTFRQLLDLRPDLVARLSEAVEAQRR
jgi:predicted amidohydrolase